MRLATKFGWPRDAMKACRYRVGCFRSIEVGLASLCFVWLMGCGGGENSGDGAFGQAPIPSGSAFASLAWEVDPDPSVLGYHVHYGMQSPNAAGSCAYEQSTYYPVTSFADATLPSVTISELTAGATYYFSVSAFNGVDSVCSNEVAKVV